MLHYLGVLLDIAINKAAPMIVHNISCQSKTPLPGVKIVIHSLTISPAVEIPTDQKSRYLNTDELALDISGMIAYK